MWLHCGQLAGNKKKNQRRIPQNSTIKHTEKMWWKKKSEKPEKKIPKSQNTKSST